MTAHQLSSARNVLERARILLREQEDVDAIELLGAVSEVIHAIAVAEATEDFRAGPWLLSASRALVERTKDYASRRKLHFLIVLTPQPGRHDTARSMTTSGVLAAIAEMEKGAEEPPPEIQERITCDQLLPEVHDTIPSPPETLSAIPIARPSTPPKSFRTFSEDDEEP